MTVFAVGDIVTRVGSDEHRILSIDEYGWQMETECIKGSWWVEPGYREKNLVSRYSLVRKANEKVESNDI